MSVSSRRAPSLSRLAPAIALAFALAPAGCAKKGSAPAVAVVDDDAGPPPGDAVQADATPIQPQGSTYTPVHVRASVREFGDIMAMVHEASLRWSPEQPFDPRAQAQAMLLQLGYGPAAWKSINWDGVMAFDAKFPPRGSNALANLQVTGSLSVLDARALIDSIPSTQRPQPLGNGMWEFIKEETRILFRERAGALDFGLDIQGLDGAASLIAESKGGPRLQFTAWDFPTEDLRLSSLLEVPRSSQLGRQLDGIAAELKSARASLDAGTDRDFTAQLSAEGPFGRLGLDPIGSPRAVPTTLEKALPGDPAVVVSMPWGSPRLLHRMIDKYVPVGEIPAPFDTVVVDALKSTHNLLDQITDDVVIAVYMTPKGEGTVLFAAGVKDQAGAQQALRGIEDAVVKALTAYKELAGNNAETNFKVKFKAAGVASGMGKADLLTVSVPKNMHADVEFVSSLLTRKKELEVISHVSGNVAFLAFGGGARKIAASVGNVRSNKSGPLSADPGLALARRASGGCQFCVGIDPKGMGRMALIAERDGGENKKYVKAINDALRSLEKIQVSADVGFGVLLEDKRGTIGGGIPKSVVIPDAKVATQVRAVLEQVQEAEKIKWGEPVKVSEAKPRRAKGTGGGKPISK